MIGMSRRRAAGLAAALAAALALPELAYWTGALLMEAPRPGGSCSVLLLGNPSAADGSPTAVQRYRVEAGVWVMSAAGCERLVISGGAAHNRWVEAETMAGLARGLGVPARRLVLEREARNTWENVALSLPSLEPADAIYVVSDPIHAHRGRRYLCRQRPDLCARTRAATLHRPFVFYALKWKGLAHESFARARDWWKHG